MASTIREVAREAGVSVATVSRVMNNSGPVNRVTRERILEAAALLRYVPNSAARSLITARTKTLGVLLPDLYGEFFSEVIRGIDQTARHEDYHLLVSSSHADKQDVDAALRAMRGRVDGLIVMSPDISIRELEQDLASSFPAVLLNCSADGSAFDAVNVDNRGGVAAMVQHLMDLGHKRIAVITGADNNFDSLERLESYRVLLQARGLYDESLVLSGAFTEETGYRAAARAIEMSDRPTAIFAFNDAMAVGAISALEEAGLRVPEDVSVAGFDDIPMSRYLNPPLTSVHVPIFELGKEAMETLVSAVQGEAGRESTTKMLQTTLVVRRSTGPATA